jgi:hypothetical protein
MVGTFRKFVSYTVSMQEHHVLHKGEDTNTTIHGEEYPTPIRIFDMIRVVQGAIPLETANYEPPSELDLRGGEALTHVRNSKTPEPESQNAAAHTAHFVQRSVLSTENSVSSGRGGAALSGNDAARSTHSASA